MACPQSADGPVPAVQPSCQSPCLYRNIPAGLR